MRVGSVVCKWEGKKRVKEDDSEEMSLLTIREGNIKDSFNRSSIHVNFFLANQSGTCVGRKNKE